MDMDPLNTFGKSFGYEACSNRVLPTNILAKSTSIKHSIVLMCNFNRSTLSRYFVIDFLTIFQGS